MYDTVNFWIDGDGISGGNPFKVLPHLSDVTERQNEKTGYSCTGYILNYKVNVSENGISLKGSLCKSFFGNNIETLTRQATVQAIEKVSDHLHTDLSTAKVTRLDISTVIPTRRPPADYLNYLGNKSNFERVQSTQTTLYYNNHQRQIIFYDKAKEANAKKIQIPDICQNSNLFRYELRYTKRLKKQLKTNVTASTLTDKVFYCNVIQNWKNEFETIQKLKEQSFTIDNIKTPKKLDDAIYAHLLQKAGQDYVTNLLSEVKAKNAFPDRKYYPRLKTNLHKRLVA